MPLTSNGKVDRKALPAPDMARSEVVYVAPRTPTELAVADIWANLLQLDRVSVRDDFFALGGHSMLAVQMVAHLRKRAAIEIELRNLFTYPTLETLAGFIDSNQGASRHPNLVPIRSQGKRTPLFLIHPIGGEVQYAFDLARHLDADQPIYALAASGLKAGEAPRRDIVEMAMVYLEAVRQVQPSGPYKVAGWSLGGMIAYEMAHQLLAAGEAVEFVGMIDTGSSPFLHARWRAENKVGYDECRAFLHWIADQPGETSDAKRQAIHAELAVLADHGDLDAMIEACQREAWLPAHFDIALVKQIFNAYFAHANAAITYQAPLMPMAVSLFVADEQRGEDTTMGWGELLGKNLEMIRIGGNHLSIVKSPHIEKLAREMSGRLKRPFPLAESAFSNSNRHEKRPEMTRLHSGELS
jgi:thioesterase domain-containing protein/acyl carrier protein